VFHPENANPVRTNRPEFSDTVNDDPNVALPADGTVPPVFEFPLYVTEYVNAVHWACTVMSAIGT
jgi:hypothetical protein